MLAVALVSIVALLPQKPVAELSFEMVGNRIYLPAKLNGQSVSAIFDTGAGGSAADLSLADALKIPGQQKIQAGGVGATAVVGRILTDSNMDLGPLNHHIPYAIPFSTLNGSEGRKLELIIGHDFITRYVFQIDYAAKMMRIYPSGSTLPNPGTEIPIRIVNGHPHIKMKATVGGQTRDVEAMIDSGASGGGFTGRFTKSAPIPASVPSTPVTTIGGGVGGFVTGRFIRPDSLEIGGIKVLKPVTSVNEAAGGANGANAAYDFLLGAEVLKRFTFTIDYANNRVFFKPNADFGKPFEADKTGLRLIAGGPDLRQYSIVGILPGSSSDVAGLKQGDKLVSIDGVAVASKTLQEWRDFLRHSSAKAWQFIVDRKGEQVKATVEAKSVI
jgi:hypothetical protein